MKWKIEDELRKRGHTLLQTEGISMEPVLHPRKSSVILETPQRALRKNDVVAYRKSDGQYILHRIVKVNKKDYIIRGDNCVEKEVVPKECVIGLMTGFFPDESDRFVSCEDQTYRRYVATLPLRYGLRRIRFSAARFVKKLLN